MVVPAEQRGEQFADGYEAAADIHAEEHEDDERGNRGDDVLPIVETFGEEVWDGDGITGDHRIAT